MMVDLDIVADELRKVARELGHPTDWYLTKALLLMRRRAESGNLLNFRRDDNGANEEASRSTTDSTG